MHGRPGTYSIVAWDPDTGESGVAVQSHWFSVGSVVSWAQAGVGAVATQSVAEVAYGPDLLTALRDGAAPADALEARLALDDLANYRQVAVVDSHGRVAVHTGSDCIAHAGHVSGPTFSCQANMMDGETVPAVMAQAYEDAEGDLAARLVAALEAAETAGGDVRGRQSAALKVVPATGEPWRWRFDVRVDDHEDPLGELRRLLNLNRAYNLANDADELAGAGKTEDAGTLYRQASGLAPLSDELAFWAGLAIHQAGDTEAGIAEVRRAIDVNPKLATLLDRLTEDLAPGAAAVRAALDT